MCSSRRLSQGPKGHCRSEARQVVDRSTVDPGRRGWILDRSACGGRLRAALRFCCLRCLRKSSAAKSRQQIPNELPDVFQSRYLGLHSWQSPVHDPTRGWIGGSAKSYGDSCAAACAAGGGRMQFNGCGYAAAIPRQAVWVSGCGEQRARPAPRDTASAHRTTTTASASASPSPGLRRVRIPGACPGEPALCVGNPCDPATGNKYLSGGRLCRRRTVPSALRSLLQQPGSLRGWCRQRTHAHGIQLADQPRPQSLALRRWRHELRGIPRRSRAEAAYEATIRRVDRRSGRGGLALARSPSFGWQYQKRAGRDSKPTMGTAV